MTTGRVDEQAGNDGRWFLTSTGRRIFPFTMSPHDVMTIGELAHSLSHICRFGGHCLLDYKVAHHSILVYRTVLAMDPGADPRMQRTALLHDAAEAYVGDLVRPVKRSMVDYCKLEDDIYAAIADRYDLHVEIPEIVHVADNRVLLAERRDLLPKHAWAWFEDQAKDGSAEPMEETIRPVRAGMAKMWFLHVARTLGMGYGRTDGPGLG